MDEASFKAGIYEVRWHGRGGQGAITAAQILAEAAHLQGYLGVTAAPSFGAERRGVPVSALTRISREPIRVYSQAVTPDVVVVLDHSLLKDAQVTGGLKPDGCLVVNTWLPPGELGLDKNVRVVTADATKVCRDLGLVMGGSLIVSTAILGAFARASDVVQLSSFERAVRARFSDSASTHNLKAMRMTYEITSANDVKR
ncbi:MAG: 2-oxoacid:acceptor oxidoreductase family protein [Chloroflexota bacterium]